MWGTTPGEGLAEQRRPIPKVDASESAIASAFISNYDARGGSSVYVCLGPICEEFTTS